MTSPWAQAVLFLRTTHATMRYVQREALAERREGETLSGIKQLVGMAWVLLEPRRSKKPDGKKCLSGGGFVAGLQFGGGAEVKGLYI